MPAVNMSDKIIAITYIVLISPYLLSLYVVRFFSKKYRVWYDETIEHGMNEGMVMMVLGPIIFLDVLLHPIRTYKSLY